MAYFVFVAELPTNRYSYIVDNIIMAYSVFVAPFTLEIFIFLKQM